LRRRERDVDVQQPDRRAGTSRTYTVSGIPITAYGFTNAGAPKALFGKNDGGDEIAWASPGPPANEIDVNNFVQLDLVNVINAGATNALMAVGSVQAARLQRLWLEHARHIGTLLGTANARWTTRRSRFRTSRPTGT